VVHLVLAATIWQQSEDVLEFGHAPMARNLLAFPIAPERWLALIATFCLDARQVERHVED